MAVLNGERMHDTMERLLPGARSAALLWQGAAVLGGAALGAGQVYGGAAPFGLALVIGCPPSYCLAAALGTLREAGAADADLLIAATSTDETNILCCLVAKRLNPRLHTIARVRSYEYAEQLFLMREELGLSMSVNPELAAASEIFRLLQFPSFIQRETFAKGRVEIVELRVDEGSRLCGVPLSQLDSITRVKVLVCAVTHGGAVTIPNGNYVLAAGDHIHVTAAGADLARLLKNLGIMRRRVRQVMLVGGGRITYYLAKRLLQRRELSITEVAQAVGYGDYAYFSRVFKKLTGISPRQYREAGDDG